jgi:rRNA maturation protein Nop10
MQYSIGESYTLPSKGLIYDKQVNPDIKLRSMTTIEEMKRLSRSDRQYKNMSEIIDDCLVEKPGISAYDMCIGDYQFLLHKLRIVTYGPDYELSSVCPNCGEVNKGTINLEDLKVMEYSDDFKLYKEVDLPRCGKHVTLRPQTPRILDNIEVQSKDMNRKMPEGDYTYIVTLENLIEEVDGKKLDPIKKEDFVKSLEMMDANMLIQYARKLNTCIGLDTTLENTCESCGFTYQSSFRITQQFFGPRVDI